MDNWYFIQGVQQTGVASFPINQRGQNSYRGAGYTIDRWNISNANVTVALGYNNYIVIKNSTAGAQNLLIQYFENKEMFAGKTVTISAIINGTLVQSTVSIPADSSTWGSTIGTGSDAVDGCAIYLRYLNSKLCFVFYATAAYEANTNILIQAAKIEIGDTQTLAHQVGSAWVLNEIPDYAEQLAKCQRYFERLSGAWTDYGSGFAINDTTAFIYLPIAGKVKTPTVTLSGTVYIVQPGRVGGAAIPSTQIETFEMNGGKGMLRINLVGTNLITSSPAALQIKDYATYIDISAE